MKAIIFSNKHNFDYSKNKNISCSDCGESNPDHLALCEECGFYFCNTSFRKESHIVIHLKEEDCTHISTDSISQDQFKCEKCGNENIFELKFLIKENEIFFLCKGCSEKETGYLSLVEDGKFNNEIIKGSMVPSTPDIIKEETHLENMLIDTRNELERPNFALLRLYDIYGDKYPYTKKLIDLTNEEIQTILNENKNCPLLTFDLEFNYQERNKCFITVKNPNYKLFEKNVVNIFKDNRLIIQGAKVRFKCGNDILLYCDNIDFEFPDGQYQIQLKESVTNFERMIDGLTEFLQKNLMNENIIKMLLGQNIDFNINLRKEIIKEIQLIPKFLEENINLNPSQEKAIRNALMYHLSLVIGPPGSGKTLLLVNLVYNILFHKGSTEKILICAPTNKAIDNIIILLKKYKYNFSKYVRVLSPGRELSKDINTTVAVHKLALEKINNNPKKYHDLKNLIEKKEKDGYLKNSEYERYKINIQKIELEIIEDAEIILTTINNSADKRLKDVNFSYVLIDEAAQALEPDTILPLIHQAQMVVLIGDDKQLGPIVHSQEAKRAGLDISLFERLHSIYKDAPFITLLNEQYRMNQKLYEFPNRYFYEDKILTITRILPDENIMNKLPFPIKDFPSFFYNVSGKEETENKSYFNMDEVRSVFKCVNKLVENKIELKNIGVITFYSAQKQKFYEELYTKEKYYDLKIDTIDGFQGMEMDYIIISTVRNNLLGILGFLKSQKRLNVSLTRARKGLIIVGNAFCLAKRPGIFRSLISFYSTNGLIVNDPFKNSKKLEIIKYEEIFNRDLINEIEDYDEVIEEQNEKFFYGNIKMHAIKKIKNEQPAPAAIVDQQNQKHENIFINNQVKESHFENNKKNNNQIKYEKKEEKIQVQEIKKKKKKKAKKPEEEKVEDEKEKEEEELKKKGNKKWKNKNKKIIKNMLKQKQNEKKEEEKKEEDDKKEEEDKKEEKNNKGKKSKKNKGKKKD